MCLAAMVRFLLLFTRPWALLCARLGVLLSTVTGSTTALGALILSVVGLGAVVRSAVVLRAIFALRPDGRLSFGGGSCVGVPFDLGSLIGGWRRFGLGLSCGRC